MYSQCVSEKSAAQQRLFEDALLELMAQKLFEEISISELCRKTGLSRKTFYRLYESKADVVYAMIDHAIMDAATFVPDESVGPGGMHNFLAYWKSQKKLLDVLAQNRISALLQQQAIVHILREAPEIVSCFTSGNPEMGREMVTFCVSGLFYLVLDWHERGFDRSIDEMSQILMKIVMTAPVKSPLAVNIYEKN
jgi:AcrR family transcriptional regulator